MGCIARLGCLLVLCVLAVGAWLTRDRWIPLLRGSHTSAATSVWQPLTPAGAERARVAVQSLSRPTGAVYENVQPGDLAAYVFQSLAHQIPSSADSAEAAVINGRMYVRAVIPVKDLGGASVLGPLASLVADREQLTLGGTFEVIRPGLAEFHVQEISLRSLKVPSSLIPKLVKALGKGARPAGVSEDALPILAPLGLGDVRLANGKVTLYKAGQ
ncbi:MAG: hypothetical protein JWO05_1104 [Gemmatimonadetes bacterium]|nr:hypothetical protein [Gemmatimonadota bacterium]